MVGRETTDVMCGDADHKAGRRRTAWMSAAQAGDGAAYAALLRDCVPVVQAITRRKGVRPGRIDNVVHGVLLRVHRVRHAYDPARPCTA